MNISFENMSHIPPWLEEKFVFICHIDDSDFWIDEKRQSIHRFVRGLLKGECHKDLINSGTYLYDKVRPLYQAALRVLEDPSIVA